MPESNPQCGLLHCQHPLETRPGERIMRAEFGSRVKGLVFEQNDAILKGFVRHYVIDAIKRWEKRVVLTDVEFEGAESNQLLVRIGYRIVTTGMEGSLVWPFSREGAGVSPR